MRPCLTRREAEVLALIARGLSYPRISDRLGCATRTVRLHVEHISMKLPYPELPPRRAVEKHLERERLDGRL